MCVSVMFTCTAPWPCKTFSKVPWADLASTSTLIKHTDPRSPREEVYWASTLSFNSAIQELEASDTLSTVGFEHILERTSRRARVASHVSGLVRVLALAWAASGVDTVWQRAVFAALR